MAFDVMFDASVLIEYFRKHFERIEGLILVDDERL